MYKLKLSNIPLIVGIFVIVFFVFLFRSQLPEKYSKYLNFTKGTGLKSYNISNNWNYKFLYLDGNVQGRFTAKNNNTKLFYSGNIEDGTVVFELYDSSDSLIPFFPATITSDTLEGIFKKGEKYKIRATVTNAKGHFDFKME